MSLHSFIHLGVIEDGIVYLILISTCSLLICRNGLNFVHLVPYLVVLGDLGFVVVVCLLICLFLVGPLKLSADTIALSAHTGSFISFFSICFFSSLPVELPVVC